MNGCLKAILVTAAVLIGSLALMCGGFALLARISRDRGAPRAGTSAPPPTTPSADETRLGKEPGYCPGRGLKHLGLFVKGPPCAVELYLGRVLDDPRSFEPVGRCAVAPGKVAWVVDCSYRARNAFGAMILKRQRFLVRDDVLLKVEG